MSARGSLKAGLRDFSWEVGAPRESYGEKSFDYGDPFVATTQRYGLSDSVTLEGRVEAAMERAERGRRRLLGARRLGRALGGAWAAATTRTKAAAGWPSWTTSTSADRSRWACVPAMRARGPPTRDDEAQAVRIDQASLGLDLGRYGYLGLLALHRDERDADDQLSISTSYSLGIGPGSLVVSAARLIEPDEDHAVVVAYALPLGLRHSVSATGEVNRGRVRARAQPARAKARATWDSPGGSRARPATTLGCSMRRWPMTRSR